MPGFQKALRLQVRFLWLSRRPLWLLAGLITVLLSARWVGGVAEVTPVLKVWPVWFLFVGPLWAVAVWLGEPPSRRRYMWSQPLRRAHQSAGRVAAGLVWLWAIFAGILAVGAAIAAINGDLAHLSAISLTGWANLPVALSVSYLAVSCFTVAFENPLRWMLGLAVLFLLLGLVESLVGYGMMSRPHDALGDLSPFMLFGPWARDYFQLGLSLSGQPTSDVSRGLVWWISWPVWSFVLCAVLWTLARSHPDRLLRLRTRRQGGSS